VCVCVCVCVHVSLCVCLCVRAPLSGSHLATRQEIYSL